MLPALALWCQSIVPLPSGDLRREADWPPFQTADKVLAFGGDF